jgi:hypothetical protein
MVAFFILYYTICYILHYYKLRPDYASGEDSHSLRHFCDMH